MKITEFLTWVVQINDRRGTRETLVWGANPQEAASYWTERGIEVLVKTSVPLEFEGEITSEVLPF